MQIQSVKVAQRVDMDPNRLLRASQKSPLRSIYQRSARKIFSPGKPDRQSWDEQYANPGQTQREKHDTAPATAANAEYANYYGTERDDSGNAATLAAHNESLFELDKRLQAVQARNELLLGHLHVQQKQIDNLQSQLAATNAQALAQAAQNPASAEPLWMRQNMGGPAYHDFNEDARRHPTYNAVRFADSRNIVHAAPRNSAERVSLLALAILTTLLLLVVVVVLVLQWRKRSDAVHMPQRKERDAEHSRANVERTVIDILSRSLMSQNRRQNHDGASDALLTSLLSASRRQWPTSRASPTTLVHGP